MNDQPSDHADAASWPEPTAVITVANSRAAPVLFVSASGAVSYTNPAAHRLLADKGALQRDTTLAEILGEPATATLMPFIQSVLVKGHDAAIETSFLGHAWLCVVFPLREPSGPPVSIALICINVTDTEQRTRQQLTVQKELTATLMKEFRHTFKNKLQSVVSLLRQHQNSNDSADKALNKAITQLLAISAVYGIRARVDEDRIYLCSIVNEVIRSVQSAYPLVPLQLLPSIQQIALTEDDAVPIALIINELVTNAVKHTRFSSHMQVRIAVEINPGQAKLHVSNSPATLATNFHLDRNEGLGSGLQLARALLPASTSSLSIAQIGEGVITTLTLHSPIVELNNAKQN